MPAQKHRYFQFSRRERRGIYVLLFIIGACFFIPRWLSRVAPGSNPTKNTEAFNQLPGLLPADTAASGNTVYGFNTKREYYRKNGSRNYKPADVPQAELYYFNPNTISGEEWAGFGVPPRTVQTILRYREKGGRFRTAADLDKIYGLPQPIAERLKPYVRIETPVQQEMAGNRPMQYPRSGYTSTFSKKDPTMILNINTADSTKWILLPGIGAGYARRIIYFREKLGGFCSVNQVAETRGLPDSVFQKIKAQLVCPEYIIEKININTATPEQLMQHPYITKQVANNIVQYRNQHGLYTALPDLHKLALVTEEMFRKISPYLAVKNKP